MAEVPALLKVLDDVVQIHPFVQVLVGAFQVATKLHLTRRRVDKRIALGFVAMRDMMAVLIKLRDISANKGNGTNTIAVLMEPHLTATVDSIKTWANLCDAYTKKSTMAKALGAASWDSRFKECIETFSARRREFEFVLSTYVSLAVEQKIDRVLQYLDASASAEERDPGKVAKILDRVSKAMEDDKIGSLIETQQDSGGVSSVTATRRAVDEVERRKKRLDSDVQIAIHENMDQFQRKFTIFRRELEGKALRTLQNESDIMAGPHAQVLDPDIREIWREMRWRGSVKGHHFVLALRGYFRDKLDQRKSAKRSARPTVAARQLSDQDEPTLEYINTARAQPVIEAFDDDASGSITLAEVNMFTNACPKNWSLLHWLAYWAVGFQVYMSSYAAKIDGFLSQMVALKPLVLPANRTAVEHYLDSVWARAAMLTSAFRRVEIDEEIRRNFEEYSQAEEQRLSQNLETVKYIIDGRETLDLVCGPGRIEKHIFPLLYVLLKRDFEVLQVAHTQVLLGDELPGSRSTISHVFDAVDDRHKHLTELFRQRKLDPALQFQTFAFETFKYWNDTAAWKRQDVTVLMPHGESAETYHIELTSFTSRPHRPREEVGESLMADPNPAYRDASCDTP
ncbi:hypothetical protein GSI_07868 [Ganoderma sinense ZZ0214-1]|uniref:EF-hand domain-containing protein n=1 Tax=Ganoderma sinense ZZ0214-1 TaxID=1077348 RepID=A0A2G8S897_9APHY|nr:hypothetical protein GSI_07868 [Ganoderma sinense ZZ0214-1]